jgi:hypothetical protein
LVQRESFVNSKFKSLVVAPATVAMLATSVQAGGVADAIVEAEPIEMDPYVEPQSSTPSWVIPAIAILLLGVAASASQSDSDDDDGVVISGSGL